MYAYPEALQHTEAALALWDQVAGRARAHRPEPRAPAAVTRATRRRCRAASTARSRTSARPLDEVDAETDPVEAGLVHERLGRYLWQVNRPAEDTSSRTSRPSSSSRPCRRRWSGRRCSRRSGSSSMLAGRNTESIDICWQAHRCRAAAGRTRIEEGHARNTLGTCARRHRSLRGRPGRARASRATSRSRPGPGTTSRVRP